VKRWTFTILLFLLLGALVNVAVAWGCACWSPYHGRVVSPEHWSGWSRSVPESWPPPTKHMLVPGVGSRLVVFLGRDEDLRYSLGLYQWGWPCRALESVRRSMGPPFHRAVEHYGSFGLVPSQLVPEDHRRRHLPIRPIFPGLIINTAFYAAILWLLIPGPFVLRRLIRLKRGRCPKCGYDLRGQLPGAGGCPECGWNRQPEAAA